MTGTRHILHHKARRARNMTGEMTAEEACPKVIILARRRTQHEPDLLVLEKLSGWLGTALATSQERCRSRERYKEILHGSG
jgi:hypothetical protein